MYAALSLVQTVTIVIFALAAVALLVSGVMLHMAAHPPKGLMIISGTYASALYRKRMLGRRFCTVGCACAGIAACVYAAPYLF